MSRLTSYHMKPGFDGNETATGNVFSDIARELHDILSDTSWIGWGRSTTRVPVGSGVWPDMEPESPRVPELVPQPRTELRVPLPPSIDRRDIPSDEEFLPQGAGMTEEDWFKSLHPDLEWSGPAPIVADLPLPQTSGGDVSIFDDVYGAVDVLAGGWLPGGPVSPFGTNAPPGVQTALPPASIPSPGVVIDNGSGTVSTPGHGMHLAEKPNHYVYKLVNGTWKWVHKRKRRCKRLLTASQARDLQLLMSITGKSSELTKIIVARGGLC